MKLSALLGTLLVAGCATQQTQVADLLSLSRGHFSSTASLKDDSLDTQATITTQPGYAERQGLLGIVWDDQFLRAIVDKKTGATVIQVYQIHRYKSPSWHYYESVNYETPAGPVSQRATVISRDVDCQGSRYGGCTFTEHVAFTVDEPLLRGMAGSYVPGERRAWKFKFNGRSGAESRQGIVGAEIAGFLDRLDTYRATLPK